MLKKIHGFLFVLGLAFLAYLLLRIGFRELWHGLISLGWGLLPFILLEFVAEGIHTIAWARCLNTRRHPIPWFRLFRIRMAGNAINYLTPTAGLGGEVTKVACLLPHCSGAEAASGVLAGKLCCGLGQLLFVAAGSVFVIASATLPQPAWVVMVSSAALIGLGIVLFLLLQKHGKLGMLLRWLAAGKWGNRVLRNAEQNLSEVDESLKRIYRDRPGDLIRAVGWHLLGHLVGIFQAWLFLSLLSQPVSFTRATAVWTLGMWFDMLTFAVPLGVGTLEGGRIVAARAIGCASVVGLSYGVALRLAQLCCAGFGLLTYASLLSAKEPRNVRKLEHPKYHEVA